MSTLIVTASSKSKCEDTDKSYYSFGSHSFADKLDKQFREQLQESRKHLVKTLDLGMGSDIKPDSVKTEPEEYLPAYIRYTGRTYSKITDEAWKALDSADDTDMIILSALYGLMRYNEPVRNYHIKQADKIESSRIATYWKNKGAKEWLTNYILNNDFDDVKFVLSTSYSRIVQRDDLIEELKGEHGIKAEDRQFKKQGRASMLYRGEYINDLLLGKAD